jgi:hypothetical protein
MFDELDQLCVRLGQEAARSPAPVDDSLQKRILEQQNYGVCELQRMGRLLEDVAKRLSANGLHTALATVPPQSTMEKCS